MRKYSKYILWFLSFKENGVTSVKRSHTKFYMVSNDVLQWGVLTTIIEIKRCKGVLNYLDTFMKDSYSDQYSNKTNCVLTSVKLDHFILHNYAKRYKDHAIEFI